MFISCTTRKEALAACPWAEKIVKVSGGYICFKFIDQYETWRNQR